MAALALEHTQYTIEATGTPANVAESNIAKLMYYLNCVDNCLGRGVIPPRLTDYSNYYSLSPDEEKAVVVLSLLLSPDELMGKVMFQVEAGNPILNNSANEFYEVKEAKSMLAGIATEAATIIVQGKKVTAVKIMVCNPRWIENNFMRPLVEERGRISSPSEDDGVPFHAKRRSACVGCIVFLLGFFCVLLLAAGVASPAWITTGDACSGLWEYCLDSNPCHIGGTSQDYCYWATSDQLYHADTWFSTVRIAGLLSVAIGILGFLLTACQMCGRQAIAGCSAFIWLLTGVSGLISMSVYVHNTDLGTALEWGYSFILLTTGWAVAFVMGAFALKC